MDVGGVGYEVIVPESVLVQVPPAGVSITLLIRQTFREDGTYLYGFLEPFQRRLFDLLTDVKGCGPKIALALIGELGEETVANAIATQDAKLLARATGVGPRLGERIILELRDRIQEEQFTRKITTAVVGSVPTSSGGDELIEALVALGYRRSDAEAAAAPAREEASGIQDQIRAALRLLKK